MAKVRLLLILPLMLGVVFGCGRKSQTPVKVTGTVKYKGGLVKAGTVQFHSKEAGVFNAAIRDDGTYLPTSLPAGDMVVTIETESANPDVKTPVYGGRAKEGEGKGGMKEAMAGKGGGGGEPTGAAAAMAAAAGKMPTAATKKENYVKIPTKYANPKTSGLSVTLTPGNQTKDFDLTD